MIDALLAFLIEPPTKVMRPDPTVIEARYRPRRARHHRHRNTASDLDACCWPPLERAKIQFLGIESFYDLFPAFKGDKQ